MEGKIQFKNVNDPEQPQPGVYRWYIKDIDGREFTLYVGNAGYGVKSGLPKGTLNRGCSEAQQGGSLSTDKGQTIDTDFIVGTTLKYFKNKGSNCIWEHIDDDYKKEKEHAIKLSPFLQRQGCAEIKEVFRCRKEEGYWKGKDRISEAESEIYRRLDEELNARQEVRK
jgi:hypothetical protein